MKLSDTIKNEIVREYNAFREKMYHGKTLEERKNLDQFFTPPELTIQMIEKMDCDDLSDKKILDPTCGSGNLLVACLIAGASCHNLYGNDYDKEMARICRYRIAEEHKRLGFPRYTHWAEHIHWGNALQRKCVTDFSPSYYNNYVKAVEERPDLLDDLKFAQNSYNVPEPPMEQLSLFGF